MEHPRFRSLRAHTRALFGLLALLVAASTVVVVLGSAGFAAWPAVAGPSERSARPAMALA